MTINTGAVHSFLGETWDIGKMLEDYGVVGTAVTPTTSKLFTVDAESPLLTEPARQRFHKFAQKLQWVSKRVAPQLGPSYPSYCGECSQRRSKTRRNWTES